MNGADGESWRRAARRLAGVAALAALAVPLGRIVMGGPVDVDLAYRFGALAREARGLRVQYLDTAHSGAEVRSLAWEWADGSGQEGEERVHHVRLLPGDHRLGIRVRLADGSWRHAETSVEVPAHSGARLVVDLAELDGLRAASVPLRPGGGPSSGAPHSPAVRDRR